MYSVVNYRWITASGARPSRPRPWVAQLKGFDDYYGYEREFIKPVYDYSYSAKTGKGAMLYFFLPDGLYEVFAPISWKHEERYFCRAYNGKIERITKEELDQCLKNEC